MNKNVTAAIAIVLVIIGAVYFFITRQSRVVSPEIKIPEITAQQHVSSLEERGSEPVEAPKIESEPVSAPPVEIEHPVAIENTIIYSDAGFSPDPITIKKGSTVIFKNNSSANMWSASAMHPTHTVYPTTGGCIGSTFDACKGIVSGEVWSFKFDIAGSWKYHNHLNPSHFGSIIVE